MIHVVERSGPVSMATWLPTNIYDITIGDKTIRNLKSQEAVELLLEQEDQEQVLDITHGEDAGLWRERLELDVFIEYLEGWDE